MMEHWQETDGMLVHPDSALSVQSALLEYMLYHDAIG